MLSGNMPVQRADFCSTPSEAQSVPSLPPNPLPRSSAKSPTDQMDRLIQMDGLSKSFGAVQAVQGLSLTVARGEIVGLLGPNGAGKSTSLRMAAGYLEPDVGSVHIAGLALAGARLAALAQLGYLAEGAPGYESLSARELLTFVGRARGFGSAAIDKRIVELTARLDLGTHVDARFEQLSKGFRRRVSLAAALFADPPALILDEPTDGLDPNQKRILRQDLTAIAATKAILISTHILEEVPALCDRVYVMARGRIVFHGTPSELEALGDGALDVAFERVTRADFVPFNGAPV